LLVASTAALTAASRTGASAMRTSLPSLISTASSAFITALPRSTRTTTPSPSSAASMAA
jgi:hypothetical protein